MEIEEINYLKDDGEEMDPGFVMDTAAEALDLLAQYNQDFVRDIDRDEVASFCRIVSNYLKTNAEKLNKEEE